MLVKKCVEIHVMLCIVMGPLLVGLFMGWLDNNFMVGPIYVVR